MIRWLIRLAGVLLTAALAYGWGDLATDPGPLEAVLIIALTGLLLAAFVRLYRPGGAAAFEWDEESERREPGQPVPAPEPAPPRRPLAPSPARPPSTSLWSKDRDAEP